jgi:hypothetical protein
VTFAENIRFTTVSDSLTEFKKGSNPLSKFSKFPLKLYILVSHFKKTPSFPKELFDGISSGGIS